jgi:hypothetical protein
MAATNQTDFVMHLKTVLKRTEVDAELLVGVMPASIQTTFNGVKYIQSLLVEKRKGVAPMDRDLHVELEKLCRKILE